MTKPKKKVVGFCRPGGFRQGQLNINKHCKRLRILQVAIHRYNFVRPYRQRVAIFRYNFVGPYRHPGSKCKKTIKAVSPPWLQLKKI